MMDEEKQNKVVTLLEEMQSIKRSLFALQVTVTQLGRDLQEVKSYARRK